MADTSLLNGKLNLGASTTLVGSGGNFYKASVGDGNKFLIKSDLLNLLHPVGSIYMSVDDTSPASLIGGTWEKIGAGYALWTASSGAGGTISAGLPNITGTLQGLHQWQSQIQQDGAFRDSYLGSSEEFPNHESSEHTRVRTLVFKASTSNSIYGSSSTVQPPAYKVYAWKRTA